MITIFKNIYLFFVVHGVRRMSVNNDYNERNIYLFFDIQKILGSADK